MPIDLHHAASNTAIRGLTALDKILDKAAAYAEARKIDPAVLLGSRLAPDMFPLSRQIQIACDFAKSPIARLAGMDVPKYEDTETTIPEFKARIAKTLAFVNSVPADKLAGAETRQIEWKAGPNDMKMQGDAYFGGYAVPNFYFHLSMAYAILRHNGLEIGKRDFLGAA
jgi:uncharacterized protein